MKHVGGTRRFASFDQSKEKAFMSSVSRHKYPELNLLDFRLISEQIYQMIFFPQRCSRILIKCWVVYQSSKSTVLEFYPLPYFVSVQPKRLLNVCCGWKWDCKCLKLGYRYVFYCFHTLLFFELRNCLYTNIYKQNIPK